MKGWIEPIPGDTWESLKDLGCDEWLWVDTTGSGVHLTHDLGDEPAQVTHVWGWGAQRAVRVRIDPDLPHDTGETGAAGALLRLGDPIPGAQVVDISETEHPVWPASAGRANMASVPGLVDENGQPIALRALNCRLDTTLEATGELLTVTFLRR